MARCVAGKRLRLVRFRCHAPKARSVALAGTFNNWNPQEAQLTRDADGEWGIDVDLAPGRHEYQFAVDGQLCGDAGLDGTHEAVPDSVCNEYGTQNRVIEIA